MLTQVTELSSLSAIIRELVKRLKEAPVIGYSPFLNYTLTCYSFEDTLHLVLQDNESFVAHMQLVPYCIDIGIQGMVAVHQTHVYLAKDYRGLGIAYRLYEWAAQRWTLIPSDKHSQGANRIWQKLTENLPTMYLRRRSKKHQRYEIVAPFGRRQFKTMPSYHVMIGVFVNP